MLDAAFRVVAAIALIIGGMFSQDKILMYLGSNSHFDYCGNCDCWIGLRMEGALSGLRPRAGSLGGRIQAKWAGLAL